MSIIEERHQALEGEVMAAKDAIWRLTTRVFHLEKEVKDLKLVLKYTAKGIRPRSAKVAELARLKKSKTLAAMGKPQVGKLDKQRENNIVEQQQVCTIKTEPTSDHLSSAEEGWTDFGRSSVQDAMLGGDTKQWSLNSISESQNYSDDSDTCSSDGQGNDFGQKSRKTAVKAKTIRRKPGNGGRKIGKKRTRSPTWENFVIVNTKYRNKDTLATCKTCDKNFAWPKIERLRKHVIACRRSNADSQISTSPSELIPKEPIPIIISINSSNTEGVANTPDQIQTTTI